MSTLPPESVPPPVPFSGAEHDALPMGTRFGEFEIQRVLGVGGFGIVYLAYDHSLEREVALKEYMPASLAARGAGPQITVRSSSFAETYAIGLRSFVNEARLLARFDHPSLVKVYRFWEDNATAYMVMPFLQGTTLRDTRKKMAHPPDEPWIRSVITPIIAALELLHREGVYHRDIAPDNILLQQEGPPILLDFGAARRVISDRTQSLTAILKPSYAPIEQYAEMTQLRQGPWTDLYALGAVIHYLLFGAPPPPATARAVQDDSDALENRIVPGVSPQFLEAMAWMLAVRPVQRPQNAEELRAVLDGHASVPPRGRPGITIPPQVANPAHMPPAVQGLPGGIEPAYDATRINTSHVPTHLPTAHARPPGATSGQPGRTQPPTTFGPTAQMPTARVIPPQAGGPRTLPPPAHPTTQPPTQFPTGMQPTQMQPTQMQPHAAQGQPPRTLPPGDTAHRPQTLPPYTAAPVGARTVPPAPASAAAARQTRPAPLAAAPAAPVEGRKSSRTAIVAGAVVAVLVIGAALAWQFAGRRGAAPAVDAAASAASSVADSASSAAPTSTTPSIAAPVAAVAPSATPAASAAVPAATTPATAATSTVPTVVAPGTPVPSRTDANERATLAGASAASGPRTRAAREAASSATLPVTRQADGSIGPAAGASRPSGQPVPTGTTATTPGYGGRPVPPTTPPETSQPTTVSEACGSRVFIALAICMDEKCEEPRWRSTPDCQRILERKRQRENR